MKQNLFPKSITRQFILQHPEIVFIYEDSLRGWEQHEPQSTIYRGHSNAYEIPVCWCYDRTDERNFFSDNQFDMYKWYIVRAMILIPNTIQYYVMPEIGKLYMGQQCPLLYKFLQDELKKYETPSLL